MIVRVRKATKSISAFKHLANWSGLICLVSIAGFVLLTMAGWGTEATALVAVAGSTSNGITNAFRPRQDTKHDLQPEESGEEQP